MRNLLLTFHIVGVAVWLGANATLAFAGPRAKNASAEARLWWTETQGAMARVLYNVAGILILITGIALVLDGPYEFSMAFVSVGFLAIVVGAGLGMAVFGPNSRKLAQAIRDGDNPKEKALSDKLAIFGSLDSVVIIVTIVAMVSKWGL